MARVSCLAAFLYPLVLSGVECGGRMAHNNEAKLTIHASHHRTKRKQKEVRKQRQNHAIFRLISLLSNLFSSPASNLVFPKPIRPSSQLYCPEHFPTGLASVEPFPGHDPDPKK